MHKTMAELEKESVAVKTYAPLEEGEIKLSSKRIQQLRGKYGKDYRHKFKVKIMEHKQIATPSDKGTWTKNAIIYKASNTPEKDTAHEEGHIVLGHNEYNAKTPAAYIKDELDAELYAHKKTNKSQHIKAFLRGEFMQIAEGDPQLPHLRHTTWKDAIKVMDKAMERDDIPETWKEDWKEVRKEAAGEK
jgi:hypothetical protein